MDVDKVMSGLKDFQRATANHVFDRLYGDNPTNRFLVADEVGLGKTLVAKGVLAQTIDHLQRNENDHRVDIVYICSNAAIARQNVRRLNVTGQLDLDVAERITMLPVQPHALDDRPVNFVAITPGTSLKLGGSAGRFEERALLFALLRRTWPSELFGGSGPARIFYYGIAEKGGRKRLLAKSREFDKILDRDPSIVSKFRAELPALNAERRTHELPTLRADFDELVDHYRYDRDWHWKIRHRRSRLLGDLREALARVGIEMLRPDLVILDEFQRFKDLLNRDDESWANRLARQLFDFRDPATDRPTRTLLLSATPYRMYTTPDDEGGHHDDLVATIDFLSGDDHENAKAFRGELGALRTSLLEIEPGRTGAAVDACRTLEARLGRVMVRTERLAATPARDGMLRSVPPTGVHLAAGDIRGYLATGRMAETLGHPDILEYWKSGPYLLNFMENYALKRSFSERTDTGEPFEALTELLETGHGLLPWNDVVAYAALDPGNARLRGLLDDVMGASVDQLVWLPAAKPYYATGTAFDEASARAFTKRLVFSSWNLVPKVISSVVSYEAERRLFAGGGEPGEYTDEWSRRPSRRLAFRLDESGQPGAMMSYALLYPSPALARLGDPLPYAAEAAAEGRTLDRAGLVAAVRERVAAALAPLIAERDTTGPVDQRWHWAAALFLDYQENEDGTNDWLYQASRQVWTEGSADETDDGDRNFNSHVNEAWKWWRNDDDLGRVPDDLIDVVTDLALASPAVVALRSLSRVCGGETTLDATETRNAAARIAWGVRSLFNGPDVTALVDRWVGVEAPYWRRVLSYGIDGNIQAVMDEYLHVLREWQGFAADGSLEAARKLATACHDAVTLRTTSYRTDVPRVDDGRVTVDRHSMRGRFAVRFGDDRQEESAQQNRVAQVSTAFNSPFWPFVLSTTSVGQEGLDFHLYCHAVVHWNLPHNPVDMEQREGRVHRFKGHAVRKNVAKICGEATLAALGGSDEPDLWAALWAAAAGKRPDGETEIFPYWVFPGGEAGAMIERHVPTLPLSQDVGRLDTLLKAVASYRLAFGQPRQEELLRLLQDRIGAEELAALASELRIDLRPPVAKG